MPNLHLFTGDAAAETVRAALRIPRGECLVQHDVISCGPVRGFASREEWIRTRDDFWLEVCGGPTLGEFPDDLITGADRLGGADRVIAWVGAGLSDRLLVPSVLALAELLRIDPPRIEVVEITAHRSLSVPVLGWGMLRPGDVGQPGRVIVGPEEQARARDAWTILTTASPDSLMQSLEVLEEDSALLAAMSALIERYPDRERGLSHWDAALLSCIPDAGTSGFAAVGGAIGANHQHLDPVGDLYLFWRLRRMSSASLAAPLLTMDGDPSVMRQSRFVPTDFGRAVRDGRASAVAENGIDDWIGGVHLRAKQGSPWYRQHGSLINTGS